MKNKGIVVFIVILVAIILLIVIRDFRSTKPGNQAENQYEYNVDEFKLVDPNLIIYKETKNFKLSMKHPSAIAFSNRLIYAAGDSLLQIIETNGKLHSEILLKKHPVCLAVSGQTIFIGFNNSVATYQNSGGLIKDWGLIEKKSVLTSICAVENEVFIADAGNRKVYRYSPEGQKKGEFEGKHEEEALHGFIVPSPYFDLAVNLEGELWVANPGNHSLENYTYDGTLRGFWENSSVKTDGFSGCCNPAHFSFLPGGSFVTSEKGLVRIKIYKPSGEFLGVVAPPDKFEEDGEAPDVAADESGNIYALDFDKKMIRLFEPK